VQEACQLLQLVYMLSGLRELYKLVHPDLFQADVTAKVSSQHIAAESVRGLVMQM
jgi:hypothetical protein